MPGKDRDLNSILLRILTVGFVSAFFAASCSSSPGSSGLPIETSIVDLRPAAFAEGERLQVVTTTSIVADIVGRIGGEDIGLASLLPLGTDPHAFEASPKDRQAISAADVVLINGLGLESFLQSGGLLGDIKAPLVSLSEGIQPLVPGGTPSGEMKSEVDPHVWTDPANVIQWARNAAEALAALDPTRAESYRQRSAAYIAELRLLEGRLQSRIDRVPINQRKLVTDHEVLGYFAARYGFSIVGAILPSPSTSAEASAKSLADLESAIRREGVRAVFVSSAVNPDLARRVADDTGARLVPLYLESLTGPEGPASTYLALMEYNVGAIVEALAE